MVADHLVRWRLAVEGTCMYRLFYLLREHREGDAQDFQVANPGIRAVVPLRGGMFL
jgi:hypothetical protein